MRAKFLILIVALAAVVASASTIASAQNHPPEKPDKPFKIDKSKVVDKTKVKVTRTVEREEQAIAAEPGVVINLCMESGRITVRGGERREVRARVTQGTKIDFRGADAANPSKPAARIEVMVAEPEGEDETAPVFGHCTGSADIELDVPRDATLFLKSDNGEFDVEGVAEAHVGTNGGNISLRHITRAVEANTIDGDVSLEDSTGRVQIESFGGSIEAINVTQVGEGDFFRAKTVSNDVMLENIGHSSVVVSTISGEVTMRGPLARAGRYDLRTTTGDITLTMPVNSSFQLIAKVSENGEIVTDFPLKYTGGVSSIALLSAGRMVGTYGKGDASINLVSFSGTMRLRRQ